MQRWLAAHLATYYTMTLDQLRDRFFNVYPKLKEMGLTREASESTDLGDLHLRMAKLALDKIQFPTEKPAAIMTIDDRAHCFMGRFRPIEWYLNFKPWNKRSPEPDVPEYDHDWNRNDEDLADQTLECLLDCLTVARDGFITFEPSAQEYMAGMFKEARKKAEIEAVKEALDISEGVLREILFETLSSTVCSSKSLDNPDDRDTVLEELLVALRRSK
jgi:hypothetical protein